MLGTRAKKEAIDRLKTAVNSYEEKARQVRSDSVVLFDLRRSTASSVIVACEKYLTDLANAPRELEKSVGELRIQLESFESAVTDLQEKAVSIARKSGAGAVSGTLAGVGIAAMAPSAALAIATTFGTASTGVAISALSGAAATNAALAWLGGGAIAASGGGMAAGEALLALAGPVGWAIAGVSLISAGGYAWHKNAEIAEEANEKAGVVRKQVSILDRARKEIGSIADLTRRHEKGVRELLNQLHSSAPSDFSCFSEDDKSLVGALINDVDALAQLLNGKIELQASVNP